MDKNLIAGRLLTGLVLAGGLVGAVSAQTVARETGLSEEQAVEIALLEVPGEVQETELEREDGTMVYEVEILTVDGQEFEIEIAADTGAVLEVDGDNNDEVDDDDDGNDD